MRNSMPCMCIHTAASFSGRLICNCLTYCDLVSAEMSDVLKAFLKALAIAKVGYNCAHKLYGEAQKKNDAHTVLFVEKQIFEAVRSITIHLIESSHCCELPHISMHACACVHAARDAWPPSCLPHPGHTSSRHEAQCRSSHLQIYQPAWPSK